LNSLGKTVVRREVRMPDDPVNPYKLGEGLFPLPFGQKKADILHEFEVSRAELEKDDPQATEKLRLLPRRGTQSAELYKELEFWIAKEGGAPGLAGLPVKVRAAQLDGTGKVKAYLTLTFEKIELNTGFNPNLVRIEKPPGYLESTEPLSK
jgi:hypothetical protein